MIAHRAMIAGSRIAGSRALDEMLSSGPAERSLCLLPLSHALERAWSAYLGSHGCMSTYLRHRTPGASPR